MRMTLTIATLLACSASADAGEFGWLMRMRAKRCNPIQALLHRDRDAVMVAELVPAVRSVDGIRLMSGELCEIRCFDGWIPARSIIDVRGTLLPVAEGPPVVTIPQACTLETELRARALPLPPEQAEYAPPPPPQPVQPVLSSAYNEQAELERDLEALRRIRSMLGPR